MIITTRPACYARRSESEWEDICKAMLVSLSMLAKRDGCIAAAWSLEVIKAQVERIAELESQVLSQAKRIAEWESLHAFLHMRAEVAP